jgi:hypothetical protein
MGCTTSNAVETKDSNNDAVMTKNGARAAVYSDKPQPRKKQQVQQGIIIISHMHTPNHIFMRCYYY